MRRLTALLIAAGTAIGAVLGWLSYDESAPETARATPGPSSEGDSA